MTDSDALPIEGDSAALSQADLVFDTPLAEPTTLAEPAQAEMADAVPRC